MLVTIDADINIPPKTAVSGRDGLITNDTLGSKVFQITPVKKYSPEKEKVALWETVMEGAGIVLIMLTN